MNNCGIRTVLSAAWGRAWGAVRPGHGQHGWRGTPCMASMLLFLHQHVFCLYLGKHELNFCKLNEQAMVQGMGMTAWSTPMRRKGFTATCAADGADSTAKKLVCAPWAVFCCC